MAERPDVPPPRSAGSPRSSRMDGRMRLSCGSVERHTAQSQAIAGTPCDVPVPSRVTRMQEASGCSGLNDPRRAALDLDVAHPQFEQDLLDDLALLRRQIAARLVLEQRENLNHLPRAGQIRLEPLAG